MLSKVYNSIAIRFVLTIFVSLISLVAFDSSAAVAGVISSHRANLDTMEAIEDQGFLGLEMLHGLRASTAPEELVAAIDLYITSLQQSDDQPTDPLNDVAMPLGCLWGEQICLKYGWEWKKVYLDEHKGDFLFAVVSPDDSMFIYPFNHLKQCLESDTPVAVFQFYQAIGENKELLEFPSGSQYEVLSNLNLSALMDDLFDGNIFGGDQFD